MKHFYLLILVVLISNTTFGQFSIQDVVLNGQPFKKITGTINTDVTLNNTSLWLLSGEVIVAPSAKLIITAGTQIFAETSTTNLLVQALGEVDWQGTSTNPVVFNSLANAPGQGAGNTTPGQWLGIRIDGNGSGSNSGIIRYVRQMYAGSGSETNAFLLENVGNGTIVEFIQIFGNANRGFRVNSGNVNFKYVVSTRGNEVGIRTDSGWNGAGQFIVVNKNAAAGNAIENRVGNATLSNITITGSGFNVSGGTSTGSGIRVRSDGTAQIYNTVITGVDTSLRFDSAASSSGSVFRNSAIFGNNINAGTGIHSSGAVFNPTAGTYNSANNNSTEPFTITDSYVGTSTLNSTPAGAINSFFTNVNYVGAVETGNDWTAGWCLNLDGTLRPAPLSVNVFDQAGISIYPNPVRNNLFIDSKINIDAVSIFNSTGKLVYENLSFANENNQIDVSQFQSGIYLMRVTSGDFSRTLKVIKQ